MDSFAKASVEGLIGQYGDVQTLVRGHRGFDVWKLRNGCTIRLPEGFARVPEPMVEIIAEVKLGLSPWEYDYWLGQQGM
jgi:hypothetical protein